MTKLLENTIFTILSYDLCTFFLFDRTTMTNIFVHATLDYSTQKIEIYIYIFILRKNINLKLISAKFLSLVYTFYARTFSGIKTSRILGV